MEIRSARAFWRIKKETGGDAGFFLGDTAFGGYCIYHIDGAGIEKVSCTCPSVGSRLMMAI